MADDAVHFTMPTCATKIRNTISQPRRLPIPSTVQATSGIQIVLAKMSNREFTSESAGVNLMLACSSIESF